MSIPEVLKMGGYVENVNFVILFGKTIARNVEKNTIHRMVNCCMILC